MSTKEIVFTSEIPHLSGQEFRVNIENDGSYMKWWTVPEGDQGDTIQSFKDLQEAEAWIGNYARYLCLNSINSRKLIIPSDNEEIIKYLEDTQIKTEFNNFLKTI